MNNLMQKLLLGGSAAALMAGLPVTASAQDIEQVVVSASRVTIAGYTQPTPVTVVGSAQLEQNAFANIQDAVRELPQVQAPPSTFSATAGAGGPGTAGENLLNLRNLGTSRTLVLFDSQRVVSSNISPGVDISTLPSALVSRVDVVTGGASAAWGSDAVAGVVNLVLNKNFDGFKANIQAGTTVSGNRNLTGQLDWGGDIFGGRGHVVFAASANIRPDATPLTTLNWWKGAYWVSNPAYVAGNGQPQLIVANDVGIAGATIGGLIQASPAVTAANSPSGVAVAANVLRGIQFGQNGVPQTVNFGNVTLGTLSNGGSLGRYDSESPFELAAIPSTTYTAFAFARYKLTDTIQASIQLNYGFARSIARTTGTTQTALVIKSDNAYIPASVRATIQSTGITSFTLGVFNGNNFDLTNVRPDNYFHMMEQSMYPVLLNRRQLVRGVFTLEGTIGDDWSWNAYAQYGQSNVYIHTLADPIVANLTAAQDAVSVTTANRGASGFALGSIVCRSSLPGAAAVVNNGVTAQGGCVPLDVFGVGVASPNAMTYITGHNLAFQDMKITQAVVEGSIQGTLPWQLPAGKIAIAAGLGYRKEGAFVQATALGGQAAFSGANYSNFPSASYNVWEGFAEVDAPIIKNGSIVQSLDVSAAGRMTQYSTSGLVETWKLGATSQINDDIKLRTTWSVDIRAPGLNELFTQGSINTGTVRDPKSQATVVQAGVVKGNAALNPEVARTISGGAVFTPTFIEGFNLSVDWYSINLTGQIGTIATGTILTQCNPTMQSTIYPGTLGNPNDPLCTALVFGGPGGALSSIVQQPINIASQTTSGLDIQANYAMDFWEGSLAWSANANLNDENTVNNPGSGITDNAGTGGTPKWKGILSSTYTGGPFSFTAQGRWYGTSRITQSGNTGNLTTPSTVNLYDPAHFEVPVVAYLDFRGSYRWNDNIQIYGAIDNFTNVPPPLIPPTSSSIQAQGGLSTTSTATYDLLGRAFRIGVRFSY